MLFLKRILVFLTPILVFLSFEFFFQNPRNIYWVTLLLICLITFSVWKLLKCNVALPESWRDFLIAPFFLVLGGLFFSLFLESSALRHFLAVIISLLLSVFLEVVFTYIHFHHKYQVYSLENVVAYFNIISFFLISSSLFSLYLFLGTSAYRLVIYIALATFFLTSETFWINKIFRENHWLFVFSLTLLMIEIFWVLLFLPFNFYASGLILTLFYYIFNDFSVYYLKKELERIKMKRYLFIVIISILAIFLTTPWR